ncbi:MAG: hypothetical protein F2667_04340 [Actinobacteria bacterium]|uniref:Unannotated protein n=1 Tax=freshwater metagenome TaxID=449393 RepID=A0A6J6PH82_9ZZZZ|nr:hypothetical protein [Actinomycetota bacterium]
MAATQQVWTATTDGREHRVEAELGPVSRRLRWSVDGAEVGTTKSASEKITVESTDPATAATVRVRFSTLGRPRRATLVREGSPDLDLVPEAGSAAATYEDRVREHPQRYAAIETLGGVATVVVPILVATLLARVAFSVPWPTIDLPDLPRIPWPDLPGIPWPDLPGIPWPDLPDIAVPAWIEWTARNAKYVWPVVLAFVLARVEIRRRRVQDEARRSADDEPPV